MSDVGGVKLSFDVNNNTKDDKKFNTTHSYLKKVNKVLSKKIINMVTFNTYNGNQIVWLAIFHRIKVKSFFINILSRRGDFNEKDCLSVFQRLETIFFDRLIIGLWTNNLNRKVFKMLNTSMNEMNFESNKNHLSLYICDTKDITNCGLNEAAMLQGLLFDSLKILKFNKNRVVLSKTFQARLSCLMIAKIDLSLTEGYCNMILQFMARGFSKILIIDVRDIVSVTRVLPIFFMTLSENNKVQFGLEDTNVTRLQLKIIIGNYKYFSHVEGRRPPITGEEKLYFRHIRRFHGTNSYD